MSLRIARAPAAGRDGGSIMDVPICLEFVVPQAVPGQLILTPGVRSAISTALAVLTMQGIGVTLRVGNVVADLDIQPNGRLRCNVQP